MNEEYAMKLLELISQNTNALETVATALNNRIKDLEQRTEQLELLGAALMDVTGLEEVTEERVLH